MLEEYIAIFIVHMRENFRKYIGAFFGFLISILWLQFGFLRMVFVLICTFVCYKLGDLKVQKKIKKKIVERLKED